MGKNSKGLLFKCENYREVIKDFLKVLRSMEQECPFTDSELYEMMASYESWLLESASSTDIGSHPTLSKDDRVLFFAAAAYALLRRMIS